ncbi:hypothetical protein J2S00_002674 [Caldalkalibacillus uzonensis]|uniref:SLH domain-containing protein n=1 Tax=Caldalkalibacillus uzonensis TaxID=353224 RepID=A0ABU0CTY6_9BACI|nr:S8 family serine peptidase [Caldalkalibacillus uzonensis]MDQ0339879.1 hypothetical protein [Caldalkalibacillus uzonensis]
MIKLNRLTILLLSVIFFAIFVVFSIDVRANDDHAKEHQEYIIKLADEKCNEELTSIPGVGKVNAENPYRNVVTVHVEENEFQLQRAYRHRCVEKIEKNHKVELLSSSKYVQYHIDQLNVPAAWEFEGEYSPIVAVVDSGVNPHFLFADRLLEGFNVTNWTTDTFDREGHGTAVAGLIAANRDNDVGIAGMSRSYILPVKVEDDWGNIFIFDVVNAIDWAVANGADIINLSLGTVLPDDPYKSTLYEAVRDAYQQGVIIVAAAGNYGNHPEIGGNAEVYPAAYPETISVAAVDQNNQKASFSSYGPTVDLSAPGVDIISTSHDDHFIIVDGTSFSAPIVTGIVSQILSFDRNFTPDQIKTILKNGTLPIPDKRVGAGVADAYYANHIAFHRKSDLTPVLADIHKSYARFEILYLYDHGIISGKTQSLFAPDEEIDRGQMAKLISEALGLQVDANVKGCDFPDVPANRWDAPYITAVCQAGIMYGKGDGKFYARAKTTREEMAVIFMRALGLANKADELSLNSNFTDAHLFNNWSKNEIALAAEIGLIRGIQNQDGSYRFDPKGTTQRQAAARLTYELYTRGDYYRQKAEELN